MRRPEEVERLYVDFDGFFASVEQQEQPHLRGRPVGVVPVDTPNTAIIASSAEAKRLGVRGIMPVREAKRLAPDIALVVARPDLYVKVNRRMVGVIDAIAPVLAVRSIDELCADVSGWTRAEAVARAWRIKADIRTELGPWITCSIGLGPNELLAKIAAEIEKPDGLVVLPPEDLPGRLLDLSLRDIPGIARGIEARLAAAGVIDVSGLWAVAPKQARAIWRSVEGERMWALLHGYAVERPVTEKSMFGHGRVLAAGWRTSERARICARVLVIKAARRLRREGYQAAAFSLGVQGRRGGPGWFREMRVAAASDDRTFLKCLDALWPKPWPEGAISVSITLHALSKPGEGARDLFETAVEDGARRRWRTLSDTMDTLNRRYGRTVVSHGPQAEIPGGYAGAKIAFGRIPDAEDFL